MNKFKFTITKVGEFLGAGLGSANQCDIGKRVYQNTRSGNLSMENAGQMRARLEKENSKLA
jgi:hypothetical protein